MARLLSGLIVVTLAVTVLYLSAFTASADEGEKKVTIDQVPKAVKQAILKEVGKGRLVDIGEFETGGKKQYEIEMVVNGKEYDVLFDENGKVLKKKFEGNKPGNARNDDDNEKEDAEKEEDNDEDEDGEEERKFQSDFNTENRKFKTEGRNRFFILMPGYRLVLEGKDEEHTVRMEIIVTNKTKMVGGVETRIVEERETIDGELAEITMNYFALCEETKSVFYFGEDVDYYKNGKIISHKGTWLAGINGAKPGLIMPGEVLVGSRFYQEIAPGVAMDRCEFVGLDSALKTPAGKFKNCLKVLEGNPLDGAHEYKMHAPGIGLIKDEDLLLVEYGFVKK